MSEPSFETIVWKGKYMNMHVRGHKGYLITECRSISALELCRKLVWGVTYRVYDTREKLGGARGWYGLSDGTVVHIWYEISSPPPAAMCYEYYNLEDVKRSIKGHVEDDVEWGELRVTPATVAGEVPEEIIEELKRLGFNLRQARLKEIVWCP
jgi:hypothetical protein